MQAAPEKNKKEQFKQLTVPYSFARHMYYSIGSMDTSPISFEHKMFPKVSQSTSPSLSAEEEGFGVERHVSFKRWQHNAANSDLQGIIIERSVSTL